MEEIVYEFPQWLKDLIINALKSAGKAAAIALCRRFIADSDGCDLGVSAIMAALGL